MRSDEHIPVKPIAPRNRILNRDTTLEFPQIQPIIDIIPKSCSLQDIPRSSTFLAGKAIGTLSVLARVAVSVRVEIEDCVCGRGTLHLEASLVVIAGNETFVVVV